MKEVTLKSKYSIGDVIKVHNFPKDNLLENYVITQIIYVDTSLQEDMISGYFLYKCYMKKYPGTLFTIHPNSIIGLTKD